MLSVLASICFGFEPCDGQARALISPESIHRFVSKRFDRIALAVIDCQAFLQRSEALIPGCGHTSGQR